MGKIKLIFLRDYAAFTVMESMVSMLLFLICIGMASTVLFEWVIPDKTTQKIDLLYYTDELRKKEFSKCEEMTDLAIDNYLFSQECEFLSNGIYRIQKITGKSLDGKIIFKENFLYAQ